VPVWGWIGLGVGVLLLIAAGAAAGWFGWKSFERRSLMRIVTRTESVEAAAQALLDVFTRLSEADDATLEEFARDPETSERRALYEVGLKADMVTDELDRMRLPRSLVSVAESVADAAYLIARESRVVGENDTGDDALAKLSSMNLEAVQEYTAQARRRVHESCTECGLEETNVYGGGLYL
jgi:hypothetical protein